jgi:mono/diheme cytochrome c family protein
MKILFAFAAGLIVAPLLFVLAAVAGLLPSDASPEPPHWESSIGMRSIDAGLEKRSEGLRNPFAPTDKATLAAGARIYSQNCAGCHGDARGPSRWGAKGLYPRAPQFFQQGADVGPGEAFAAVHDGIRYSGMGAWRGELGEDDMWKVANFVASFRGKGGMKDMD